MKTYWQLKEELAEKYTEYQRQKRDMGRNQPPGTSASKIASTARQVVRHMGGAAVMPRDLARRKHGGAGMATDGPAPGHAAARGVKKRDPNYKPVSRDVLANPRPEAYTAEISQKTLDTYMDKAAKSRKKSRDYFDKSTSHSQNPKVVAKHKANIDKRTKGMGSVFKRDAVKKRPEYIHKPTYGDNMEKGKKGYTMVNKPASKLPKSYKDR